ncbi:MAG: cellulose biosynthesis cyclic di-GMP-binding regulatory protein BcsB [Nannocystaceae bacterium]|nr:cellulose biosynthesis cyclic di-GMP-binding regulatory protein BcsB [Nannocystaceae bacterium]
MTLGLALVSLALLGPPAPEPASVLRVPLIPQPVVLRGRNTSSSVPLRAPRRSVAKARSRVSVRWQASELIDLEKSSMTVSIDGRPVRTAWMSDLDNDDGPNVSAGDLLANLGAVSPGPHLMTVSAQLVVDADPCLERYAEQAWVTLTTESEVRHDAALPWISSGDLRELPEDWRRDDTGAVALGVPLSMTPDTVLAVVEAAQTLQRWGLKPTLQPAKGGAGPAIIIRSVDQPDAVAPSLLERLAVAPKPTRALVELSGLQVTILARTAADLPRAVTQFASEHTRALCPVGEPCLLSTSVNTGAEEEDDEQQPAQVLSLSDIGYAQGWTAEGPGKHELRIVWPRPASWTVEHRPQLRLKARVSQHPQLDREASSVTIRLNGRPLATWHLAEPQPQFTLAVGIPNDAWADEVWVFDVVTHLRAADDIPCAAIDNDVVWFTLQPDSALFVDRSEALYSGIAGFYRTSEERRPVLVWTEPRAWQDVVVWSTVLLPFAEQTPQAQWRWADDTRGPATQRITFSSQSVPPGLEIARGWGRSERWWLDTSRTFGTPMLDVEDAVLLSYGRDDRGEQLAIVTGLMVESEDLVVPPYATLVGRHAVWNNEAWASLDTNTERQRTQVVRRTTPSDAPADQLAVSERERVFRRLNVAWLIGALVVMSGLLLVLRRRGNSTTRDASDLETMRPEDNDAL